MSVDHFIFGGIFVGEKKMNKRKLFCFYLNIGILTTYNKTTLQEVKKYFEI